ncbi:hypothetical protein ACNKHO_11250 [Shigella flexneri]
MTMALGLSDIKAQMNGRRCIADFVTGNDFVDRRYAALSAGD